MIADLSWHALLPFMAIGFVAQLIDGTIGMGFGVVSNISLVLLGIPPASAGAAVRTAESFASGVSGISHALRRNVDWSLFARLVLPGIVGGLIGVWLVEHAPVRLLRPVVFAYLGALGIYLVWRAPRRPAAYRRLRMIAPVGVIGALVDATGGGWGPIVTGNLLAQGGNPRSVIGTVNAAEFFVTITVLAAFIGTLGPASFTVAAVGLLIGGVTAAPLGALLVARVASKPLTITVGGFLIASSLYGLAALAIGPVPLFSRY